MLDEEDLAPQPGAEDDDQEIKINPLDTLTAKQVECFHSIMSGPATHILLRGGSRSGKSFLFLWAMIYRALRHDNSTHVILRYRFNHLRASIIDQTLPAVMRAAYPGVPWRLNQTEWSVAFNGNPQSGKLLFGGLDDKERTEKILGQEHSTIWLNECTQISYSARNKVITRLAQKSGLKLRAYYDENPPAKGHWTYKMWFDKVEPLTRKPLLLPEDYVTMRMNPHDNEENIAPEYIRLLESLPEKDKQRFLRGEFVDEIDGALWSADTVDGCKVALVDITTLIEIVIAVDPSGCSGEEDKRSDEVGIVVAGRDAAGVAYVLEDASGRMGPLEWSQRVFSLYQKWNANRIIAEQNYGGAMVEAVLRSANGTAPIKLITASRGKHVRADPVAAMYSKGRVKHCGDFFDLEEQLLAFSASGYTGDRSPDRADALVWAMTELLVPPDNSLAILDYMREQSEHKAIDKVKEGPHYTRMKAPDGIGTVFGRYGAMYNVDADGCINAEIDDVEPFKRNGFVLLTQELN